MKPSSSSFIPPRLRRISREIRNFPMSCKEGAAPRVKSSPGFSPR